MFIYKIINKVNNKVYVGQTIRDIRIRFIEHKSQKQLKTKLFYALKKYGKDMFEIELLEICNNKEHMAEREGYWIKYFNSIDNGYNTEKAGLHKEVSIETRKKLSISLKGKKKSDIFKKKISDRHSKKIYAYNLEGFFIKEYKSAVEASEDLGVDNSTISLCARGGRKTAAGFQWKYFYTEKINKKTNQKIRNYKLNSKTKKTIKVIVMDNSGCILGIYNSISYAAKIHNCDVSTAHKVVKGKLKSTKGLIFKSF